MRNFVAKILLLSGLRNLTFESWKTFFGKLGKKSNSLARSYSVVRTNKKDKQPIKKKPNFFTTPFYFTKD